MYFLLKKEIKYVLLKPMKADETEFVTAKGQSDKEQWLFYNIQFTANEHFVSILTSEKKNTNDIPPDKVALYRIKVFSTS